MSFDIILVRFCAASIPILEDFSDHVNDRINPYIRPENYIQSTQKSNHSKLKFHDHSQQAR